MTDLKPQNVCPELPLILRAFSVIEDPRRAQAIRHPLLKNPPHGFLHSCYGSRRLG